MTDAPKKRMLPRIEILIVLVFFLSFIIWAVSQCKDTQSSYAEQFDADLADSLETTEETLDILPGDDPVLLARQTDSVRTTTAGTTPAPTTPQVDLSTRLYITIDGLNMRTSPHLDSPVVMKFNLFDEVFFLNEVTDSTQKINLGLEYADEPWVKVRHKRGFEGWVYGAGVDYIRKKRTGVQ